MDRTGKTVYMAWHADARQKECPSRKFKKKIAKKNKESREGCNTVR